MNSIDLKRQSSCNKLQSMDSGLGKESQSTIKQTTEVIRTVIEGPKTIEIAGRKILGLPLEAIGMTPEQEKKFIEAGGIINPSPEIATEPENKNKMMYWSKSFETLEAEIDGIIYHGFKLFKKVYEAFPNIQSMTEDEAKKAGLYPIIHYRNYAAREWMAKMIGGHFATLDSHYDGELDDIYNAVKGRTNLQKLAAMGQAPLGWFDAYYDKVYGLGNQALLGSGSINDFGIVRTLRVLRGKAGAKYTCLYKQISAISSVIVLDK